MTPLAPHILETGDYVRQVSALIDSVPYRKVPCHSTPTDPTFNDTTDDTDSTLN